MAESKSFPPDPGALHEIRSFVRDLAVASSFGRHADDLALAATEACTNAMVHSDTSVVRVNLDSETDHFVIEVADEGVFKPRIFAPEVDGEGHRGFHLMAAMVDELSIREGTSARPGTVVRLVKRKD